MNLTPLTHYTDISEYSATMGFVDTKTGVLYAIYAGNNDSPIASMQKIGRIWDMDVDYFEAFLRYDYADGTDDFKIILDILLDISKSNNPDAVKAKNYLWELYKLWKREKKENPKYADYYGYFKKEFKAIKLMVLMGGAE